MVFTVIIESLTLILGAKLIKRKIIIIFTTLLAPQTLFLILYCEYVWLMKI